MRVLICSFPGMALKLTHPIGTTFANKVYAPLAKRNGNTTSEYYTAYTAAHRLRFHNYFITSKNKVYIITKLNTELFPVFDRNNNPAKLIILAIPIPQKIKKCVNRSQRTKNARSDCCYTTF